MKIVLATGIYAPDIGGPATYVRLLAEQLQRAGLDVTVIAYGAAQEDTNAWPVILVSKSGGPLLRWWRYASALRKYAPDADIVYVFSTLSVSIPLRFSGLRKPKRVLRLGGDFLWERQAERGGAFSLREWYESGKAPLRFAQWLLSHFDHLIFSTAWQRDLYQKYYKHLPAASVIENANPTNATQTEHKQHQPFRLLFSGRLVPVKNLHALLNAVAALPSTQLTIVGDGPEKRSLQAEVGRLGLHDRVLFVAAMPMSDYLELLQEHDLLVMPSLSDISPNAALEACAAGLPVLLTKETGLSAAMSEGMTLRELRTPEQIVAAISEVQKNYEQYSAASSSVRSTRSWQNVAKEHLDLFEELTRSTKS
ncbi:MAG TPA: glycosyltransferase family 4 protein [Candidatus Peribacteraceae bacterium]|nr:glycosyltransferase family 4 protein [Candidatus Peribacteraceae bacterium]